MLMGLCNGFTQNVHKVIIQIYVVIYIYIWFYDPTTNISCTFRCKTCPCEYRYDNHNFLKWYCADKKYLFLFRKPIFYFLQNCLQSGPGGDESGVSSGNPDTSIDWYHGPKDKVRTSHDGEWILKHVIDWAHAGVTYCLLDIWSMNWLSKDNYFAWIIWNKLSSGSLKVKLTLKN